VIGGAEIYREALLYAGRIYLTEVFADYPGDTWFPPLTADWHAVSREEHTGCPGGVDYAYVVCEREAR
jgi:dihydrofolate reductase